MCVLPGATVRFLETAPVIEGQSANVCVIIESENTQIIDILVNVTMEISSIGAGTVSVDFQSKTQLSLYFL